MPTVTGKLSGWIFSGLVAAVAPIAIQAQPYVYLADQAAGMVEVVNPQTKSVVNYISLYPYTAPGGMAISSDGTKMYVTSDVTNSLQIVNPSTSAITKSIPTGTRPSGVAIAPDGAEVWVADNGSAQVTVVNTASQSVIATIAVGNLPSAIAFTPDGSVAFVANTWDGTVSIINTSTLKVQNTFSTGNLSGACALAVSASSQLFVANCYSNTVTVHNTSGTLLNTISGFAYPDSLAIVAGLNRLVVSNGAGSAVTVVDMNTMALISNVPVAPNGSVIAVAPDGMNVYTAGWTGTVTDLNACTNAAGFSIPWATGSPVAIAIH